MRTAVGKAQLLMSQRFQQFSSLIDDCALRRGVKVTTCDDLQGFWDMVYVQVQDVLQLFEQLQQLRLNDWQPLVTTATAASAQGGRKKTRAAKKTAATGKSKFAAFRAQLKKQVESQDDVSDQVCLDDAELEHRPLCEKLVLYIVFVVHSTKRILMFIWEIATTHPHVHCTCTVHVID